MPKRRPPPVSKWRRRGWKLYVEDDEARQDRKVFDWMVQATAYKNAVFATHTGEQSCKYSCTLIRNDGHVNDYRLVLRSEAFCSVRVAGRQVAGSPYPPTVCDNSASSGSFN